MERRRFIQAVTAGLVALSTPKVVDKGLELIASASAEEKAPISETEFERLVGYDTVDDILKEYGIGSVDDSTYKEKVYDSDKHVIVFFYNNLSKGSKGLAVLTGLLSQEFGSQFEVLGYKMSESSDKTPIDVFHRVIQTYGLKDTPATLFYDREDTTKAKDRVNGRINSYNKLLKMLGLLTRHINNNYN